MSDEPTLSTDSIALFALVTPPDGQSRTPQTAAALQVAAGVNQVIEQAQDYAVQVQRLQRRASASETDVLTLSYLTTVRARADAVAFASTKVIAALDAMLTEMNNLDLYANDVIGAMASRRPAAVAAIRAAVAPA